MLRLRWKSPKARADYTMLAQRAAIGLILFSTCLRVARSSDASLPSASPSEVSNVIANAMNLHSGQLSSDSSRLEATVAAVTTAVASSASGTGSPQVSLAVNSDSSNGALEAAMAAGNVGSDGRETASVLFAGRDVAPTTAVGEIMNGNESPGSLLPTAPLDNAAGASNTSDIGGSSDSATPIPQDITLANLADAGSLDGSKDASSSSVEAMPDANTDGVSYALSTSLPRLDQYSAGTTGHATMGASGSLTSIWPFSDSPEASAVWSNDGALVATSDRTDLGLLSPASAGDSVHTQTQGYGFTLLDGDDASTGESSDAAATPPHSTASLPASAAQSDLSPIGETSATLSLSYDDRGLAGSSSVQDLETATRLATPQSTLTDKSDDATIIGYHLETASTESYSQPGRLSGSPELRYDTAVTFGGDLIPSSYPTETWAAVSELSGTDDSDSSSPTTSSFSSDSTLSESLEGPTATTSQTGSGSDDLLRSTVESHLESPAYTEALETAVTSSSYQHGGVTTAELPMGSSEPSLKDELLATAWSSSGLFNAAPTPCLTSAVSGLITEVPPEGSSTNDASADLSDVAAGSTNPYESITPTASELTTDGLYAELGTWSQPLLTPSGAPVETSIDDVRLSTEDVSAVWSQPLLTPSDAPIETSIDDVRLSTADVSAVWSQPLLTPSGAPIETSIDDVRLSTEDVSAVWSQPLLTPSGAPIETSIDDVRLSTADVSAVSDLLGQSDTTQSDYGHSSPTTYIENLSTFEASWSTGELTESPVPMTEEKTSRLLPVKTTTQPAPGTDETVLEDRRNNSVVVSLSMTLKMYTSKFDKKYRKTIADAANEYCRRVSCQGAGDGSRIRRAVQALTTTSALSGSSGTILFTAADVGLLPGYPKNNNDSGIDVATYLSSAPYGGVASGICISSDVLLAVILSSQANISTSLGVTVLTIFKLVQLNNTATPGILASEVKHSLTSGGSKEWMVITAALATLIVLVVAVIAVVKAVKKFKRKGIASVSPSITKINDVVERASTSASSADMWYAQPSGANSSLGKTRKLRDLERSSSDLWYAESAVPQELPIGRRRVYHVACDDQPPVEQHPPENTAFSSQRTSPPPSYSVLPPIR